MTRVETPEEIATKIEQLLRGTDLTPAEIGKQIHVNVREVYRNKAWPEVRAERMEKKKGTKPTDQTGQPGPAEIGFLPTETAPPIELPPIPETEQPSETETKPGIESKPFALRYGAFNGMIDAGLELFCETAKLEKPNVVKIEKLDHALVDFSIAWKIDFRDPRLLPTIILAATIAEISLPMVKEFRQKTRKPAEHPPTSNVEKAVSETIPLTAGEVSTETKNRVEKAIAP